MTSRENDLYVTFFPGVVSSPITHVNMYPPSLVYLDIGTEENCLDYHSYLACMLTYCPENGIEQGIVSS